MSTQSKVRSRSCAVHLPLSKITRTVLIVMILIIVLIMVILILILVVIIFILVRAASWFASRLGMQT